MKLKRLFKFTFLLLIAFLNFGCASKIMVESQPVSSPDPNESLITFILPSSITDFGPSGMSVDPIEFDIWDGDKFIGAVSKKTYIQYQAKPGDHVFYARGGNWTIINGNLEAGKKYYVLVNVYPGFGKHRLAFQVIKNGSEEMEISLPKWLDKLTPMSVIPENYDKYSQKRSRYINKAIRNYELGRARHTTLSPSDGV